MDKDNTSYLEVILHTWITSKVMIFFTSLLGMSSLLMPSKLY